MIFSLILQPEKLLHYGHIPCPPLSTDSTAVVFYLEEGDEGLLAEDFIDSVDAATGALVDLGDVDYLDAGQCVKLRVWISERLDRPCPERLRELYAKLDEFAERAIELGTGLVIEL